LYNNDLNNKIIVRSHSFYANFDVAQSYVSDTSSSYEVPDGYTLASVACGTVFPSNVILGNIAPQNVVNGALYIPYIAKTAHENAEVYTRLIFVKN